MKVLLSLAAVSTAAFSTVNDDPKTECCETQSEAACCSPEGAAPSIVLPVFERVLENDETAGSVSGTFSWEGDKPDPKPDLTIGTKESEGCDHDGHKVDTKDRTLLIGAKGGVANIVVTLEAKGVEVKIPDEPVVIDQKNCRFEPHVVVLPVGATLKYENSDPVNHNIHTYSRKNDVVNKNVSGGTNFEQKLENAESFEAKCDIHPWMKSHVVVTDATHWAVTDAKGNFSLKDVPAGDYKAEWWHEELGKGKFEFTVEAGKEATVKQGVGASTSKKAAGGRRRR